jgi:hypothetical protein
MGGGAFQVRMDYDEPEVVFQLARELLSRDGWKKTIWSWGVAPNSLRSGIANDSDLFVDIGSDPKIGTTS